jgi:hypothetical protein
MTIKLIPHRVQMDAFGTGSEFRRWFVAAVDTAVECDRANLPWYRLTPPHPLEPRENPERERLLRIAGRLDLPYWLVDEAVEIIRTARACGWLEASERLAVALERYDVPDAHRHRVAIIVDFGNIRWCDDALEEICAALKPQVRAHLSSCESGDHEISRFHDEGCPNHREPV